MQRSTQIIIFILLTQISHSSKFQLPALDAICPSIKERQELIDQMQANQKNPLHDKYNLSREQLQQQNARKFVSDLSTGMKPNGTGSYGMVFVFKIEELKKSLLLTEGEMLNDKVQEFNEDEINHFRNGSHSDLAASMLFNDFNKETQEIVNKNSDMDMIFDSMLKNEPKETLAKRKPEVMTNTSHLKSQFDSGKKLLINQPDPLSQEGLRQSMGQVTDRESFMHLQIDAKHKPLEISMMDSGNTSFSDKRRRSSAFQNEQRSPTFGKQTNQIPYTDDHGILVVNEDPLDDYMELKLVPRAMKLLKVGNKPNMIDHIKEQERLLQEINVMQTLKNDLSNYDYFFPEFLGCTDLSEDVNNFLKSVDEDEYGEDLYDSMKTRKGQILAGIEMQKLSFNMVEYLSGMVSGFVGSIDVPNRILMSRNLATAISFISMKFIHCDIKPENVMFQLLDNESLPELIKNDYPIVENESHQLFLVKIIDFGISKEIEEGQCGAGTPGYIPPEYFSDAQHQKFDVFSLGITLIDFELGLHQFPTLSDILSKIFMAKSNREYRNKELFSHLAKNLLFKKLIVMTANQEIKNSLIERLRTLSIWEPYLDKEVDFQKILKFDMNVLEFTILHCVGFFMKEELYNLIEVQRKVMDDNIRKAVDKLVKSAKNLSTMQQQNKLNQNLSFFSAHFALSYWAEKSTQKFFDIILQMIEWDAELRPDAQSVNNSLMDLYDSYLHNSRHERKFLEEYDNEEQISYIETSVMSSMLISNSSNINFTNRQTVMNDLKNSVLEKPDYDQIFERRSSENVAVLKKRVI